MIHFFYYYYYYSVQSVLRILYNREVFRSFVFYTCIIDEYLLDYVFLYGISWSVYNSPHDFSSSLHARVLNHPLLTTYHYLGTVRLYYGSPKLNIFDLKQNLFFKTLIVYRHC